MNTKKILLLALVLGIVGGVIGYALTTYVAKIYVEITQPAAVIETREFKIDAAPYQTFTYYDILIASVVQKSDLVEYSVKIRGENISLNDACVTVMSWGVTYYSGCGLEHKFTMKNIPGGFSIYLTVKGKSTNTTGIITAEITFTPLP